VTLSRTREILARRGLHLRRDLGQNYLVEEAEGRRLTGLARVGAGDLVVEVGTGLGALTRALAERVGDAGHVVSVEIDSGVVRALREEPGLLPANATLVHDDALRVDLAALAGDAPRERVHLVANLPYSSATPLLRRMLDLREHFADWSVMVQREVGARLVAAPGSRDYGSLAVLHRLAARVEVLAELPPAAFFPAPRVVSSFLRIEALPESEIDGRTLRAVERVVRVLFGQRRKTISNGLRAAGFPAAVRASALAACDIAPRARAETIAPERLRELVAQLAAQAGPAA